MSTLTTDFARPATRTAARTGLLARVAAAFALHRQRRQLRDLDAAMLRDIGLSRDEALRESRRAAWDVPSNWRV